MRHPFCVFYCRTCGHRSEVKRDVPGDRICPKCRHYGYKFIVFNLDGMRQVNATLKTASARPITPSELT